MRAGPLFQWSGRDLSRHRVKAALVFLGLSTLTAMVATVLLLNQAVALTFDRLLDHSPAIIVRQVGGGGWLPLPTEAALSAARAVPGVVEPRTRIWGVVNHGDQAVTIVGLGQQSRGLLPDGFQPPGQGEALIGPGVATATGEARIVLTGQQALDLLVRGQLPPSAGMAVHDLVLLHADDARSLLGLRREQASDLALEVFHPEEAESLANVLKRAFPWPVQVTTRSAVRKAYAAHFSARGGAGLLSFIPALLALVFLIVALGVWGLQLEPDMGLMKAMGWTSGDLLQLHLTRAALMGCPAFVAGLMGAWILCVFAPGNWVTRLLFEWSGPPLALSSQGLAAPLALTTVVVFFPYLSANFWSGWRTVQADPMALIQGRAR